MYEYKAMLSKNCKSRKFPESENFVSRWRNDPIIMIENFSTDHGSLVTEQSRNGLVSIKIFSLIETETSTSVHYNNSKKIPGIIVTDANENDQLIDDLLLLDTFKSKVGDFLHDGIKNGKAYL